MTHEDAGNYAAKRSGAKLDKKIASFLKEKISENNLTCAEAHRIAGGLNVDPNEVGTAIDLLNIRITKCQLGLFGYGQQRKVIPSTEKINPGIEQAIEASLINGRLPCATAWKISEEFKVSKTTVASACEKIKVKISSCQLGAFR